MDLKPLITLLAIVNPLAIVPFFIHYTQGFSEAQRKRRLAHFQVRLMLSFILQWQNRSLIDWVL